MPNTTNPYRDRQKRESGALALPCRLDGQMRALESLLLEEDSQLTRVGVIRKFLPGLLARAEYRGTISIEMSEAFHAAVLPALAALGLPDRLQRKFGKPAPLTPQEPRLSFSRGRRRENEDIEGLDRVSLFLDGESHALLREAQTLFDMSVSDVYRKILLYATETRRRRTLVVTLTMLEVRRLRERAEESVNVDPALGILFSAMDRACGAHSDTDQVAVRYAPEGPAQDAT